MWESGSVSDVDAGAAAPDGGPHIWLSSRHHGEVVTSPLGCVSGEMYSEGWLDRALCH